MDSASIAQLDPSLQADLATADDQLALARAALTSMLEDGVDAQALRGLLALITAAREAIAPVLNEPRDAPAPAPAPPRRGLYLVR